MAYSGHALRTWTAGRQTPTPDGYKELTCIAGRRSGKSNISAVVACHLALFYNYEKYLTLGERGTVQVISSDRAQSQTIMNYCRGILTGNPIFSQYVKDDLKETISLTNSIDIIVHSCSYKSIRGKTGVAALCDEISFWMHEGQSPDREILAALRPVLATIPGSKLIKISSPYAKRGEVYRDYKEFWGSDNDRVLVWQAPTVVMNPTIDTDYIDSETKRDLLPEVFDPRKRQPVFDAQGSSRHTPLNRHLVRNQWLRRSLKAGTDRLSPPRPFSAPRT